MKNKLQQAGVKLFSEQSYNATRNAQHNLEGRTHWADEDTLKFFGCRISSAYESASGLIFTVRYSQQKGFDASEGRVNGYAIFDIFGNHVVGSKEFKTAKARDKEFFTVLKQCETYADKITQTAIDQRIKQCYLEIDALKGV